MDGGAGSFCLKRFVEKPDRATAESYLASGRYLWNSGMFLMSAERLLSEMESCAPAVLAACREALAAATVDEDFLRLQESAFARQPSVRSEEHTSELQSLMRISYAVFCLKKKKTETTT